MECKFRGRLVHADTYENPLHHLRVELSEAGLFGEKLAEGYTDAGGKFEFTGRITARDGTGATSIVLQVFDEPWSAVGPSKPRSVLKYSGVKGLAGVDFFEFGNVRVPYWEYEPEWRFPTPRLDKYGNPPQDFLPGFRAYFLRKNWRLLVLKAAIIASSGFRRLSVASTQSLYPENLTLKTEKLEPGKTRDDAWFADRTFNGFSPALPSETDEAGVYAVRYDWEAFDSDGVHNLSRVEARFRLDADGFHPIAIDVAFREAGQTLANASFGPTKTYEPADGALWRQAKRVFRSAWAVAGETETHLTQTHLNVGQYACAAFRNLRQNPVRELLFPNLQEVIAINNQGASAIFGPQGVLSKNTPLTPNSCWHRLLWRLGQLDWSHWAPRKPLFDGHRYAKAANLFWEVVTEYVDGFFATHDAGIRDAWHEVHAFSVDLVAHAVVHVDYPFPRAYDKSEISVHAHRIRRDGSRGAVSPITDQTANPSVEDVDNLKQVCRYAIFHATFFHSWTNDAQADEMGEVVYASLALRNGSMGEETDEEIAPLPLEASEQLYNVNALSQSVRGLILSNEFGDVRPEFIAALSKRIQEFQALGVDAARIRSRINI